MAKKPTNKPLPIGLISAGEETQMRYATRSETVDEYAELFTDDVAWPFDSRIVVFQDGDNHWLADGFHRLKAADKAGRTSVHCEVHNGTLEDAQDYALAANSTHGLQRTNEDKRKAVLAALDMDRWASKSNCAIADHVGVSESLVRKLRKASENSFKTNVQSSATVEGSQESTQPPNTKKTKTSSTAQPEEEYEDYEPEEPEDLPEIVTGDETAWAQNISEVAKLKRLVESVIRDIKAAPSVDGFEMVDKFRNSIVRDLNNAKTTIGGCIPHSVCPYCLSVDSGCNVCNSTGWVNRDIFNQAPKDMQNEAKKVSSGDRC